MKLFATGPLADLSEKTRAHLLARGNVAETETIAAVVRDIGLSVREGGDARLIEYALRFDGATLSTLEVPRADWDAALARTPADIVSALKTARDNIAAFHKACLPKPVETEVVPGVRAGRRIVPYARIGAYVPGGRASYPSTVLMTVVPAKVAGVSEVVVVTPPGKNGRIPDATLAACAIAGADRVFAVGGAQAIFALAHGTESVPRVDKIVGPGNAYVAAAKAQVAGVVSIDSPAGPSEVLVLADDSADPRLVALELIAQAEHDPRAACIALTTSPALATRVESELTRLSATIERADVVSEALAARGAVLAAENEATLCAWSEAFAPEHLVLLTRDPRATLDKLTHYGSAFLGPWSAVALGDYCSGPNHVLPTAGLARSYGGLGVDDFVRRPTHQEVTKEGLARIGPVAENLARFEGLPNHASSIAHRRKRE